MSVSVLNLAYIIRKHSLHQECWSCGNLHPSYATASWHGLNLKCPHWLVTWVLVSWACYFRLLQNLKSWGLADGSKSLGVGLLEQYLDCSCFCCFLAHCSGDSHCHLFRHHRLSLHPHSITLLLEYKPWWDPLRSRAKANLSSHELSARFLSSQWC